MIRLITSLLLFSTLSCKSQNEKNMEESYNPLLCDPNDGICEIPIKTKTTETSNETQTHALKIIYFTDPICSSCWGIEPQLRKLKLEYGNNFEIEYRMGGLLPDWSYNSGGISKPSDVAHHWDEVSLYYDMPIDGDVWLEDPLHSSYPPSIAFKAAQIQDYKKAILFLREIREMVFLQKKNITKWGYLEQAAKKVGLNIKVFKNDFENKAKQLFEEDLKLARQYGVRGFPTMFFINNKGDKEIVYGSKPYNQYESAILKVNPNIIKDQYSKDWSSLFSIYNSLTTKEFSELSENNKTETENILKELFNKNQIKKFDTKNGAIWISSKF